MKKVFFAAALVFLALFNSCKSGKNNPGRVYMPDMTYSSAAETYSEGVLLNEEGFKMSARKPVKGTIPRGFIPSDESIRGNEAFLASYMAKGKFTGEVEKWEEEYALAGKILKNPLPLNAENKEAGKQLYQIQCTHCHGETGNGQGQLVTLPDGNDGPYTAVPPDYKKRLPEINDGNMFYSISYGKGMMGAHKHHLNVTERWQVIQYIKSLAGLNETSSVAPKAEEKKDETKTKEEKK